MKYLIKYLLKFHRETFLDVVVADYFESIPQKVTEEAMTVLKEKRPKIDKWIAYQSFYLQRRMVHEPEKAPTLFGMLLQLKLMSRMIAGSTPTTDDTDYVPVSKVREEKEREAELAKHREGVEAFKKGKKK